MAFSSDRQQGSIAEFAHGAARVPQTEGEILPPSPNGKLPDYAAEQRTRPEERERRGWHWSTAPATYFLTGVNCLVFISMVLSGVSPTNPGYQDLLHWGANNGFLVLNGQWWRLLTATFVHVGLLHLGTNMWCLWNLGLLGEPLIGPLGLIAVYFLTGIAGNLLSTAVDPRVVGAGASGAVFGIAGILIVLLSNKSLPIPRFELHRLRKSVIWFAVLNFVLGGGLQVAHTVQRFQGLPLIDNMAHLGGFLSGMALGVPLMARMTSGRQRYLRRQGFTFAAACVVLSLFGFWISKLY
ncbi:MAG: rhomboid family intramembrane serine protease [Acidobacteriaceae bacterium]